MHPQVRAECARAARALSEGIKEAEQANDPTRIEHALTEVVLRSVPPLPSSRAGCMRALQRHGYPGPSTAVAKDGRSRKASPTEHLLAVREMWAAQPSIEERAGTDEHDEDDEDEDDDEEEDNENEEDEDENDGDDDGVKWAGKEQNDNDAKAEGVGSHVADPLGGSCELARLPSASRA